jgi:hypothetical protein
MILLCNADEMAKSAKARIVRLRYKSRVDTIPNECGAREERESMSHDQALPAAVCVTSQPASARTDWQDICTRRFLS